MGERTPLALLERARFRAHGCRGSDHEHRGRGHRGARRRALVRQLDGGVRRARRGRGPVRHGEGRRRRVLSRARHHDSGRQGFAVDEDELEAARRQSRRMVAPLSLIVSAFAPVRDVRRTLTPQLRADKGDTRAAADRPGWRAAIGSAVRVSRRCTASWGARRRIATIRTAGEFLCRDRRVARCRSDPRISRSFRRWPVRHAGGDGIRGSLRHRCAISARCRCRGAALFNEELGAVLQIRNADATRCDGSSRATRRWRAYVANHRHGNDTKIACACAPRVAIVLDESRTDLRRAWSETSYRMTELRDNPQCAREQFATCDGVRRSRSAACR